MLMERQIFMVADTCIQVDPFYAWVFLCTITQSGIVILILNSLAPRQWKTSGRRAHGWVSGNVGHKCWILAPFLDRTELLHSARICTLYQVAQIRVDILVLLRFSPGSGEKFLLALEEPQSAPNLCYPPCLFQWMLGLCYPLFNIFKKL